MMRFSTMIAVAASLAATAALAAPSLKPGAMLVSADGKRIGPIDRITPEKDGAPGIASVIFDDRFVHVPASTISVTDKAVVTSLSRAEVRKLD